MDLKPENVLVCLSDELLPIVKIKNMGLSKLVDKTRSTAMPLRGFAPLSAQIQVSCLTCPQRHTGFFNVTPLTLGMCPFGKLRIKMTVSCEFLVGRQCNTLRVSEVTHRSYFQRDLLISTVVNFGPHRQVQIDGSKETGQNKRVKIGRSK